MFGSALMSAAPMIQLAEETGSTSTLPTIAITQDMLTPLVQGVVDNIAVVLPMGLGLFAIFLGIRVIPSLVSRVARFYHVPFLDRRWQMPPP